MENSTHYELEQIQIKLAEKIHLISDPRERERFLKIAVDLGRELEKIEPDPDPNADYFRYGEFDF